MKKKLLSAILSLAFLTEGTVMASACAPKKGHENSFDYDSLYKTARTAPYDETEGGTTRASFGYTLKSEQGYNGWYYLSRTDGADAELSYHSSAGEWRGNGVRIKEGVLCAADGANAVRKYIARKDGEAVVYGNFRCEKESSPAAVFSVFLGDEKIYGGSLDAGDTAGGYFEIPVSLQTGDCLFFAVGGAGSEVFLNPVVTYENAQNSSLYHLTAAGKQYGDVFPYYDAENHKLYMGFLWSDNAALADNYHNALEVSENMLAFSDIPEANNYEVWQRYKQKYRLNFLFDCSKFIDTSSYAFGVRDNMLYFDEENNRYLLVAGCYHRFDSAAQTSDLVIYSSDDSHALSWTQPGNVVEAGYAGNLPECPSLMKIGDRWYVFVSVAYRTAHQVGPLQYWTGDAGTDCLDVDWTKKEFAFLDGEDLCAARPTKVGDKVYMWGWIPSLYDSMPWSPWAGYLNLPREVVQRPDGSLGGRLDPGLSKLINYGNVYTLSKETASVVSGGAEVSEGRLSTEAGSRTYVSLGNGYRRNYVTFRLESKGADEMGYVMRQAGKEYRISVVREHGKTYMKVLSPNDATHKVNSVIEIAPADKFDFKIVIDGGFVEFFVNNEYALTAHTAMTDETYEAQLYTDGAAAFSETKINKLIPYAEI